MAHRNSHRPSFTRVGLAGITRINRCRDLKLDRFDCSSNAESLSALALCNYLLTHLFAFRKFALLTEYPWEQ